MKILGIIPSRYGSTRFPGKPLIEIDGKTMIQRVYEQAKKSRSLAEVIVATDDARISEHVNSFGGHVMMTSTSHESGTDRCAEVVGSLEEQYDVAINIQGDEPYINPLQIDQLCACFDDAKTEIATLVKEITTREELWNPNRPKVEITKDNFAKMFSRNPIPSLKNKAEQDWVKEHTFYKHIGIYGYKTVVLEEISRLSPSPLEKKERLEQLRWIENNYAIKIAKTSLEAIAIDSPEDLERI